MKKIINNINYKIKNNIDLYLLVGLSFSLPFDRIPSVELFGISIRFSTIFALLIILRAAYLFIRKRNRLSLILPQKILVFLMVWICLLIPESINLQRGVMVALFNIFTILTAISVSMLFDKKYIRAIIKAIIISSLIAVIFGIYQYAADLAGVKPFLTGLLDRYTSAVFGFPRIQGFSYEPLYFASYLMLPISFSIGLILFDKKNLFSVKLLYILLSLYSYAVFLTASRGGLYALIVLVIASIVISFIYQRSSSKRIFGIITATIIGLTFGYLTLINFNANTINGYFNSASKVYTQQILETSLDKDDERAVSRQKAFEILSGNKLVWVFGIGPGQYGPVVQNNQEKSDGGWFIVNNLTLELLVELGLVGLVLVVVFFSSIVIRLLGNLRLNRSNESVVLSAALILYLASQAVQYQSYSTLYVVILWTAAGMSMATISTYKGKKLK